MSTNNSPRADIRAVFTGGNLGEAIETLADDSAPVQCGGAEQAIHQQLQAHTQLTSEQVYIRAMWVVSDQVNSYGGVIPRDVHPLLASLLIDAPVLVGHQVDWGLAGENLSPAFIENRQTRNICAVYCGHRG